jgi:hypothetical protein
VSGSALSAIDHAAVSGEFVEQADADEFARGLMAWALESNTTYVDYRPSGWHFAARGCGTNGHPPHPFPFKFVPFPLVFPQGSRLFATHPLPVLCSVAHMAPVYPSGGTNGWWTELSLLPLPLLATPPPSTLQALRPLVPAPHGSFACQAHSQPTHVDVFRFCFGFCEIKLATLTPLEPLLLLLPSFGGPRVH